MQSAKLQVVHFADVSQIGGIERNLVQLIVETHRNGTLWHSLFADGQAIHPFLEADIRRCIVNRAAIKYKGWFKIPRWPAWLRARHHDGRIQAWAPDIGLLWHWFGDILRVDICRRAGIPAVYWERGLAWGSGGKHTTAFLDGLSGVLSNCHAGKRMLELRWGYQGETIVIPNAVIPRRPAEGSAGERQAARDAPFRVGTAGRLRSFKGINLALHTIALLRRDGRNVTLDIAGDGPLMPELRRLAERLGIAGCVNFLGLVDDMPTFFERLDCYLHPALREPFGTVCVEAQTYGCPVLTTRVDGMPEVVLEGQSGACLPASLDLARFPDFDSDARDVHAYVYDPDGDCLRPPAFVPPEDFADKIAIWMDSPDQHRSASEAAVRFARGQFGLETHLAQVQNALMRFSGLGGLR